MQSIKDGGLGIGELADLAATTPRAVRHYHQLGLLAEPERDESGYRRYGPPDLIRLVRIRRLRSVGMPLERIAATVGTASTDVDIASALRSLADEIEQQIARLADLRTRVLDIAVSGSLSDPAATWEAALRQRGVLEQSVELPPAEQAAAQLIDALHPQGIQGVIDETTTLTLARRHTLRVWLLWSLGVLVLAAMPVALVDPAVLMLLLDPELVALLVVSLAGLIRVRPRGQRRTRNETSLLCAEIRAD